MCNILGDSDFLRIGEVVVMVEVVTVERCLVLLGGTRGAGFDVASITRAVPRLVRVISGKPSIFTIRVRRGSMINNQFLQCK